MEHINELAADLSLDFENDPFNFVMTEKDLEQSFIRKYWSVPYGVVIFDNDVNATDGYTEIKNWYEKTILELVVDPKFNANHLLIDNIKHQPNSCRVFFEAFSETEENMYWQLNYFLDFCKTLPGIKKFDTGKIDC